jgi:hypothetical protein
MNIIDNIGNDIKQKQKEFTKTLKHFMLVSCTFTAFITTGCLFSQTNNVNYAYACLASIALIFIFTAINEVKRFLEFNFLWIFCTIVSFLTMYFQLPPVNYLICQQLETFSK